MTGASKILTVSYGTFSCTLEGFDDPFNTMKAIAEYFRDLAADDRYFGAEPPTPDAAMLHRIAEREIQRRVEAKIADNGVILRAGDSAAPMVVEPQAQPRPALAEPDAATTESVAERLQRIRARQSAPEGLAPAPVAPQEADDSYIEDEHAEAPVAADPAPITLAAPVIEVSDQIESLLAEPESAPFFEQPGEQDLAVGAAQGEAAQDEVGQPALDVQPAPIAAVEDQPVEAPETIPASINVIEAFDEDALLSRLAAPLAVEEAPGEDAAGDEDLPAADFDEAGLLARLAVEAPEPAEAAPDALSEEEGAGDWDSAWDEDELNLQEIDFSQAEPVAAPQDAVAEAPAMAADLIENADQPEPDAPMAAEAVAAEAVAAEVVAPAAARARARVIRIRRAAVAPTPQPETVQPEASQPAEAPTTGSAATALSDEEEAALQAELAALEAELGIPTPAAQPEPLTAAPEVAPRRAVTTPAEDEAVNRLMAQANTEMSGEATRRRQSAIAHLKAAVAATEADRQATGQTAQPRASQLDAYRSDLDRVVRPRRPVADSPAPVATSGDAGQRPTPLVLVSAQRIDRTETAAPRVVTPVRPRRPVPRTAEATPTAGQTVQMQEFEAADLEADEFADDLTTGNVFADATSFQDFADQLGAQNLPDLLEAAAVYCAEVLQRPEFSRPLVMRQLSALPSQSDTAREDFLRGFGTLLRQGRITKVKRGMFALTDRSPYLAEARKLAG